MTNARHRCRKPHGPGGVKIKNEVPEPEPAEPVIILRVLRLCATVVTMKPCQDTIKPCWQRRKISFYSPGLVMWRGFLPTSILSHESLSGSMTSAVLLQQNSASQPLTSGEPPRPPPGDSALQRDARLAVCNCPPGMKCELLRRG